MKDIESRDDIEKFLRKFYENLFLDAEIKKVFEGIDFEKHLPHIIHFWSFVLLDESGYKTNVFEKHLNLPIQSAQFDRWLSTFTSTVDSLFKGEKADLAKLRATSLAYTFKSKWQQLKKDS